ncbi:MAG: dTDP-4-dehydrorhamnose reductase [Sideroxydans sp.]|nr:dTDP-4-dehydrorhamnose reductase [Sideroxydans sp.]
MRTILLTGKNGQVGWELQRTLAPLGRVVALGSDQLNLADQDAIRKKVRDIAPHIIVNPAAYTNVDKAESEPELAHAVNGIAPGILAEEAARLNAWLVHYSTDYVFDGNKQEPYLETDEPNPQNIYGKTKLAGEEAVRAVGGKHLILRTSWVYGARGRNFMLTMLRLAKERDELRVVDDQVGAPTWSRSVGEITALILAQIYAPSANKNAIKDAPGTYHLTSCGNTSWFGFAAEILRMAGIRPSPQLVPVATREYPTPAKRPMNSVLSNDRLASVFGLAAGNWDENLQLCMQKDLHRGSSTQDRA